MSGLSRKTAGPRDYTAWLGSAHASMMPSSGYTTFPQDNYLFKVSSCTRHWSQTCQRFVQKMTSKLQGPPPNYRERGGSSAPPSAWGTASRGFGGRSLLSATLRPQTGASAFHLSLGRFEIGSGIAEICLTAWFDAIPLPSTVLQDLAAALEPKTEIAADSLSPQSCTELPRAAPSEDRNPDPKTSYKDNSSSEQTCTLHAPEPCLDEDL